MGFNEWNLWTSSDPNWGDFCCPNLLNELLPIVHTGLGFYGPNSLILVNGTQEILPGLTVQFEGGHTSDQTFTVMIESGGSRMFVLGDAAFSPLHFERLSYACTHDHHQLESIQTRTKLTTIFEDSDILMGMHFAFPGMGYFVNGVFNYFNGTLAAH